MLDMQWICVVGVVIVVDEGENENEKSLTIGILPLTCYANSIFTQRRYVLSCLRNKFFLIVADAFNILLDSRNLMDSSGSEFWKLSTIFTDHDNESFAAYYSSPYCPVTA